MDPANRPSRPIELLIMDVAQALHMHPADVDPRGQSPRRAAWFWRMLEIEKLAAQFRGNRG